MPQQAAPSASSTLLMYGMLILIFVVMYFFMIRPQKKREKEAAAMRHALEVGDEIITIGGIVGTVVSLREIGRASCRERVSASV